jgi:clan AA aspartic protease (TIGR02281 family)
MIMRKNFLLTLLSFTFIGLGAQTKIILEKKNGVYYIPCKVNGLDMKFVFDSGASDVTISIQEAIALISNGSLKEQDLLGTENYRIANGDIVEGTRFILKSLIIGGIELINVKASISHSLNAPLLLGQSAMRKLGRYTFDYSTNSLIIHNPYQYLFAAPQNKKSNCVKGNCHNGFGVWKSKDYEYVGNFKYGLPEGYGEMTSRAGYKYKGQFKNARKHGKGTWTYPDGYTYVGQFIDDEPHGLGTLYLTGGHKFTGEFQNGIPEGTGTWFYPNSEKYVGSIDNGLANGEGKYYYSDGSRYEGGFKNDMKHGFGIVYYANDEVHFKGNFKENLEDGFGTKEFSNKQIYEGNWQNGQMNGNGTITYKDGLKFTGEFSNGMKNGKGTILYPNGTQVNGFWENDRLVGKL